MGWIRQLLAFALAVAATALLGTLASTHFVLAGLVDLNVELPLSARLFSHGHDIVGMGPVLALVAAAGFVIAFPVAALARRFLPRWRAVGYPLAGAAAMLAALLLMESVLGLMPVAGARGAAGLVMQGVAGAVGGYVFAAVASGGRGQAASL